MSVPTAQEGSLLWLLDPADSTRAQGSKDRGSKGEEGCFLC